VKVKDKYALTFLGSSSLSLTCLLHRLLSLSRESCKNKKTIDGNISGVKKRHALLLE